MKVLVLGKSGQLAQALAERVPPGWRVALAGRPEFDLDHAEALADLGALHTADAVVNAAAWTDVDGAEANESGALRQNGEAAGTIARLAAAARKPLVHVSTDYVFDGSGERAWEPDDPVAPLGAYGRTKLVGERAVAAAHPDSLVVRTAWVYSPFGRNFVKTMLRLAEARDELRVVSDQLGNPTSAFDLADGIFAALSVREEQGAFPVRLAHLAGTGDASWADFAAEIMAVGAELGGPTVSVTPIPSAEFPTPAERPKNSRLSTEGFAKAFGYRAPPWRQSLRPVVERLLAG